MSTKEPKLTTEQAEKLFPTKWTSTQPKDSRGGYMIKAYDLAPANVPGQRVTGYSRDGRRKVEASVPHLRYHKFIDEAGNVRAVPVSTTRAQANGRDIDSEGIYEMQMRNEARRVGWVDYVTGDYAPEEYRVGWPAKREDLIAYLQGEQRLSMDDSSARHADMVTAESEKLMQAKGLKKRAKAEESGE